MLAGPGITLPGGREPTRSLSVCASLRIICGGPSLTGSAITWKYPGVILKGDNSVGEFYSVALTARRQQADTGSKMVHIGKNTTSTIISKVISAGHGQNTYRGLVDMRHSASGARNFTQCDSLLIGKDSGAHTLPMELAVEAQKLLTVSLEGSVG